MKISLIDMDLSGNCLGRTILLGDLLRRAGYDAEIIGSLKRGSAVWPPARSSPLPITSVPFRKFPGFFRMKREMAALLKGDMIYAVKPVMSSFGVGLWARRRLGRPLLVDVDDWELGFFLRADFWGRVGRFLNFKNPNGMPCTWYLERRIRSADGLTVSNSFLRERFGGHIVPHVRDMDVFDPKKTSGQGIRQRFGWQESFVVMFLGTPRAHKGVDDLADAVRRMEDPRTHLALVGMDPAGAAAGRLREMLGRRVTIVGMIPFADVPDFLAAADVVAVPQRQTYDTLGQIPAKIFDAMAMARPLVVSDLQIIREVVGDAALLVPERNPGSLATAIARLRDHPETAALLGEKARRRCLEQFSYRAAARTLATVVEEASRRFRDRTP
jgi:glycosyltransferase involved in cell wall biosynthesis